MAGHERYRFDSLAGRVVAYDADRFSFGERFAEELRQRFGWDQPLDQLHTRWNPASVGEVYAALYALEDAKEFRDLYEAYAREVIQPLFDAPARYQRKPGIRIHLPGTQTVQYHTDEWYGHGAAVVNFWTPLTDSRDTASLYVASLDDSIRETSNLEQERASLPEINDALAHIAKPLELRPGQTYIFTARCVHGTESNMTGRTRVSIDYRVLPPDTDAGMKNAIDYYAGFGDEEPGVRRAGGQAACSYLLPKLGFTRHIDSSHQRVVVAQFAESRGITIVAEETEIRTMSHHPALLQLAHGLGTHRFDSVVLFSVLCLPPADTDRLRIYRAARENGVELHFALERASYPSELAESDVEELFGSRR